MSSETRQGAPDYAEPIIGVRAWRVDKNGLLYSTTRNTERWMPKEVKEATCDRSESIVYHTSARVGALPDPRRKAITHEPPYSGCSCGLYAFYDRRSCKEHGDRFSPDDSYVTGLVSAWGKVILCEYGFRSQYMKLEALVLEQETIEVFGFPVCVREAFKKLSGSYRVPLLSTTEVEAFSKERGAVFETRPQHEPVALTAQLAALTAKPVALIEAILEWREESEDPCCEHRPGSPGGEGGAAAPPDEGGKDGPSRKAREAGPPEEKEEGEGSGLAR